MKKIIKILMLGLFIILYGIGYCLVHLDKNVEAISKIKSLSFTILYYAYI